LAKNTLSAVLAKGERKGIGAGGAMVTTPATCAVFTINASRTISAVNAIGATYAIHAINAALFIQNCSFLFCGFLRDETERGITFRGNGGIEQCHDFSL
jgi:hypothetical protein